MKTILEPSPLPLSREIRRITPERERRQQEALIWGWCLMVLPLTSLMVAVESVIAWQDGRFLSALQIQGVLLCFVLACLVIELRAATPAAAAVGGVICLDMTLVASPLSSRMSQTLLPALITLFLLTFAATHIGYARKLRLGLAEARHGRAVYQIIANLGGASLLALGHQVIPVAEPACIAMLASATADTLASELGPILPGRTVLLTSWRQVPRGTDGGISLGGTLFGIAGAAAIVTVGIRSLSLDLRSAECAFVSAIAGFMADSLFGATLERRGVIGNDMVNFLSTVVAGVTAIVVGTLMPL